MKKKPYSKPMAEVCNIVADCLMNEGSTMAHVSGIRGTVEDPEEGGLLTGEGNETDDNGFHYPGPKPPQ